MVQMLRQGKAAYSVEKLDDHILNERSAGETCFMYNANEQYLVYGVCQHDSTDEYLLTRSLNIYDYKNGALIQSIPFIEDSYVGDAILNGNKLYYSKVPLVSITADSAVWEIHEIDVGKDAFVDKIRQRGTSSFCDYYPKFTSINNNVIFLCEDMERESEFTFGCKTINDEDIITLFSQRKFIEDADQRTCLLSHEIKSNGQTAFFFLYEDGDLFYVFIDGNGIKSKTLFTDRMYHCGMIKDGLMISQVVNEEQSGKYYQVSVVSDAGQADSYLDLNREPYYRFLSTHENHSMAINRSFNLYLFEYKDNEMKRTRISLDPTIDALSPIALYVGDECYLIASYYPDESITMHLVTISP